MYEKQYTYKLIFSTNKIFCSLTYLCQFHLKNLYTKISKYSCGFSTLNYLKMRLKSSNINAPKHNDNDNPLSCKKLLLNRFMYNEKSSQSSEKKVGMNTILIISSSS